MDFEEAMKEYKELFKLKTPTMDSRNHQLVVFVRTEADSSSEFKERVNRFCESINRDGDDSYYSTIKADVYTVSETEGLIVGVEWPTVEAKKPLNTALKAKVEAEGYAILELPDENVEKYDVSSLSLRKAAHEAGYNCSIVLEEVNSLNAERTH